MIRGPNVTPGYEANPDANVKALQPTGGWFRTGDQGMIDDEGYLRITGRLKEIINRGGEKISPLEVDDVLMDHPAVAQVVTFAMPHAKLGEEVACAVVLRDGMIAVEQRDPRLRPGPARRLQGAAPVVILAEIPKGATGKLQRIGLAAKAWPGRMKICIFGAGAIGGLLGARLARRRRRLPDRARAASGGDARARPDPALGGGGAHGPAAVTDDPADARRRRTTSSSR